MVANNMNSWLDKGSSLNYFRTWADESCSQQITTGWLRAKTSDSWLSALSSAYILWWLIFQTKWTLDQIKGAAWSGFIVYISMVKCSRKLLQVCLVVSFVIKPAPTPRTTTPITPQSPSGIINICLVDQGLKILESNVYSNIPLYYEQTGSQVSSCAA